MIKTLHLNDAIRLLEDGRQHDLVLFKLSSGDILKYERAQCFGTNKRGGTHRLILPRSRQIREMRDVSLVSIDNLKIFW